MKLRFAEPGERQALEDLQRAASLVHETYRAFLLADPGAIHLPQFQLDARCVRVAERGGKVLGFTAVLPVDTATCDLDGLFVEPGSWKTGIGRALVEDAFAQARSVGRTAMTVVANPDAEGFYLRLGFTRIGTMPTQFGIAGKMRRNL